jgi:FkbM family methyltransferase
MSMIDSLLNDPLFAQTAPYAELKQKPLGFIDIGARGGVHPLVEPLAGVTAVLGFEPDEAECERMKTDPQITEPWAIWDVEPCALAAETGEALLYLMSAPTNHSLRPANEAFVKRYKIHTLEQVGTFPLSTTSLDEVLFSKRPTEDYWGEFVKLDTQGTEFEILQGAERTLSERTVAIFTEVEFFQMYQGQKLFAEVEQFLRSRGFSFYGFGSMHYRSCKQLNKYQEAGIERTIWADAVFFKDPLPGNPPPKPLSSRQIYVLFACAMVLGYYDYALELALSTWADGAEAERIKQVVRARSTLPIEQTCREVAALAEQVNAHPELANVNVGRFVDRRRQRCDYDDVQL